ncbi:MAG: hypothetical protein AB7V00_04650 [Bacilli bacterium]
MAIINNEKLNLLLAKHDEKTQLFVSELNTLNNEYFPVFTSLKKERGNRLYGMGWAISLLAFLSFLVLFGAIEPLKLIYLLYGIVISLLAYSFILVLKTHKELKEVKKDWDKKHRIISEIKNEASTILEEIQQQIYYVIASNENKTIDEVKDNLQEQAKSELSPMEMIAYYEAWGKAKTGQMVFNVQDFLESRRRKAEIMTEKKNPIVN